MIAHVRNLLSRRTARQFPRGGKSPRFPPIARRLPDEGRGRPGDLHRQGQEPPRPRRQLLSQSGGRRLPHGPPGAGNPRHRLPAGRERGRRPADGSPADQGHPAQVQSRPPRRQDLSLPGNPHARGISPRGNHPHAPRPRHEALRAVYQHPRPAGRPAGVAEDLQVPHLLAGHRRGRSPLAVVPPLPAGLDPAMHGPLQPADLEGGVPQEHPSPAAVPGRQEEDACWTRCGRRWRRPPSSFSFEEAARLRDEIHLLETLDQRGKLDKHVQPEVFPVDPKKGLAGLQKVLHLDAAAADRRGHRHRPHRRHGNGGQRGAVHRRPAVQAGLSAAADPHGRRASTILPASTRPFRGDSSGWPKDRPRATPCPTSS